MLSRLLVIALFVLLPLQSIWAAAAPYCAHETTTQAATHFGHHEHQHVGAAADSDAPGGYHADCDACHLGMSAPLPSPGLRMAPPPCASLHADPASGFRSHVPSVPEPPDRT